MINHEQVEKRLRQFCAGKGVNPMQVVLDKELFLEYTEWDKHQVAMSTPTLVQSQSGDTDNG